MFELQAKTIVVVANSFNPSIFSTHWCIKNEILNEEDILPNSISTADLSQIVSKYFNLVVLPNQLIFNMQGDNDDISVKALQRIIEKLPHVPYSAIGVNYNYFGPIENDEGSNWSRKLFFNSESKLHKMFDSPDGKFGVYLSSDFEGSRLKLDIKPAIVQEAAQREVILYNFNFHKDLNVENSAEDIIDTLDKWSTFLNYSSQVMQKIYE